MTKVNFISVCWPIGIEVGVKPWTRKVRVENMEEEEVVTVVVVAVGLVMTVYILGVLKEVKRILDLLVIASL